MALTSEDIYKPSPENIEVAARYLKEGHLVVIPTETVYGLAADAKNPLAVSRIFEAKKRPFFDPLICHISDFKMLEGTASEIPDEIQRLIEKFWPGPLTVILEKNKSIPDIVSSGLSTVAVRMPGHSTARNLIETFGGPLAAPSANMFGRLSPTIAEHTLSLQGDVAAVIDGGPCIVGVESTIVRYFEGSLYLLRPGGVTIEELEDISQSKVLLKEHSSLPEAPGQLPSHYAPHAPVRLVTETSQNISDSHNVCYLGFTRKNNRYKFLQQEILAPDGDLHTAAARLFEMLHKLDSCNPEAIYVETVPEEGLGAAIMNRLRKSAAPRD